MQTHYPHTLWPIYHLSLTLIDSHSRQRIQCHSWMHIIHLCAMRSPPYHINGKLTTENTLQTGRRILVGQYVFQKSGRSNEGAIVLEIILNTKILTTTLLVGRLAWVASDGVSCIDIEMYLFLRLMTDVPQCGRRQNGAITNLWQTAWRVRPNKDNSGAFERCFSDYQSKSNRIEQQPLDRYVCIYPIMLNLMGILAFFWFLASF